MINICIRIAIGIFIRISLNVVLYPGLLKNELEIVENRSEMIRNHSKTLLRHLFFLFAKYVARNDDMLTGWKHIFCRT